MKKICVFGSSSSAIEKTYLDAAYRLGELLAENGWELVFGAGTMGMMGAAARGVHSRGGRVTGVIPEFMDVPGIPYEACDEYFVTPDMRTRKQKMEDLSDGFIATAGGFGTFEELCEVVTLKQLKRHRKPVVILNTNGFFDELLAMFEKTAALRFAKSEALGVYAAADTPEQAIELIRNYHYTETGDKWFTPESP